MTRTKKIVRTLVFAAALLALALPLTAPGATSATTWSRTYFSDVRTANQYIAMGNHPNTSPYPVLTTCGWESCWDMGYGWVKWRFSLYGPDHVPYDWAYLLVDDDQWFAGAHCQYTVERLGGGFTADVGTQCHFTNGRRGEIPLYMSNMPSGEYDVRVFCWWTCDHSLYSVRVTGGFNALEAYVGGYTTSHDVSSLRAPTSVPQTCVDFTAYGSPNHNTRVEVDWGDGQTQTLATSVPWSGNVCHPYPGSLINYQVCLRVLELNGLRGSITECKDVPGGAQI